MRLTVNKIKEIVADLVGEEGLLLVDQLGTKENVSEFDLASKTKKDIKVIRRTLYILYNHSLVRFIRKKDKNKGWYIYYWTLLPEGIKFAYIKRKKELVERLIQSLWEEGKELFFLCPNHCVRLNFDQATDFEFHCPECGELISQDDTKEKIQQLKKEIEKIKEELKDVEREPEKKIKGKNVKIKKVNKKKVRKMEKKTLRKR